MQVVNHAQPAILPLPWVDKLIKKLQIMYGKKFAEQWGMIDPLEMRDEWAEELAGYTGAEIARGLDACRARTFVPTLPEFMMLCRPPLNLEISFHEAVHGMAQRRRGERGDWSHPAIFHAAVKLGSHDILNSTFQSIKSRWEKALNDQLMQKEWAPVPDAVVTLPAPAKTEASNEEAKAAMERMGAGDVLDKSGRDHKAWIKKILDNPKRDSYAARQMAERAAGEAA